MSRTVIPDEGNSTAGIRSRRVSRGRPWNAEKLIPNAVALIASRPDLEGMSVAGWLDEMARWGA